MVTLCLMISLGGCGKDKPDADNSNSVVQEQSASDVAEQSESDVAEQPDSKDNVQTDMTPEEGKQSDTDNSKELYEAFLAGNEKVYTDKYSFIKYDDIGKESSYYGEDNDGYTIENFLAKVIEVESNSFAGGPLEELSYAYMDCGTDGVPELGLHAVFNVNGSGQLICEYVIKAFDGKLQLCYQNSSYYRAFTSIVNEYGKVQGYGSYGAATSAENCGYLNADGTYDLCYDVTISYDGAQYLDARLTSEIVNSEEDYSYLYVRAYNFEATKNDSENGANTVYCGEKDDDEPSNGVDFAENVRKLKSLCESAGVQYYSLADMAGVIAEREKKLGVSDEARTSQAIDWKKADINLDNVNKDVMTGTIQIHPFSEENIMWENEHLCHITDNGTKLVYHLNDDTVIKEEVPCFEQGFSATTWLSVYLGNSDIVDADPDKYIGLCFTMGDLWEIEVDENNNILVVNNIYYWD